jgi:two-component system cell cycle response regulator DivK
MFVMDGERILIVDDDPMSVKLVRALLTGAGYLVRSAKSAEEALTVLKTFDPRLILIDIQLPGMNGLELSRQLRSTMQKTSIVALTAYAMAGDEQKARDAGCDGYITKPIDVRTLPSVVDKFLKQRHVQDGLPSSTMSPEPGDGPGGKSRDSLAPESVGPPSNAKAGTPAGGDNEDLLTELRNNLLVQGMDEIPRLLADLAGEFNADKARRFLHRWAGTAGTLGYPEITRQSRKLDELLAYPVIETKETLRAGMQDLMACFSESAFTTKTDRVWPPEIVSCFSGKRLGLIGFSNAEVQRLTHALQQVQASARAFTKAAPGAGILSIFDVLVVKITATSLNAWTDPEQLSNNAKPLLLVGPCEALLTANGLGEQPDFLTPPWEAEEVILRIYRLLSKSRARRTAASLRLRGSMPVVVIADDDVAITQVVSATLRKFRVDCRIASDGAQALRMVKDLRPSALVLDINMPRMDGFDVLMRLRGDAHTRNIPVILLTGRRQEEDVMRGFGYGAADYVIKPFNPTELAARVSRLIE